MKKQIKIAYFPSNALANEVLESNGVALDNYCTSCVTTEDNGNYLLDATFTIDALDYIAEDVILKVLMDYDYEIFRISKVKTTTRYITVVARQYTIGETINLWLDDVRPTDTDGQGALSHLLTNSSGIKDIYVSSNITNTDTAYYQKMSMYKAIQNSDNSFTNKWGGEIQRRWNTLTINATIGVDRGVEIREAKNLLGFEANTNIDDICTRGQGKGYNGIYGNYIDSPLIDNYPRVHYKVFDYPNVRLKATGETEEDGYIYFDTEEQVKDELDRLVALEFSNNDVDKIKATYNINFIELEKTEEYKNYTQAERIYLGDTITVYIPKLDVNIKTRAITKKYDVILQKTKELTLSNTTTVNSISMNSILTDLAKQYTTTGNNGIATYIDAIIKAGMQNSYVTLRNGELLAMDSEDVNTATKVVRLNKNGLGFSNTGYYGEYTYGFTIDGKINASLISTGILSAIRIQSNDGSTYWNLNDGEMHINKGLISGNGSSWRLDTGEIYLNNGRLVGSNFEINLASGILTSHGVNSGYDNQLTINAGLLTSTDWMGLVAGQGLYIHTNNDNNVLNLDSDGFKLYLFDNMTQPCFWIHNIDGYPKIQLMAETSVNGDFSVTGNKNCLQQTEHYGQVPFYANEDTNSLLTYTPIDNIYATELQEDGTYICKIDISNVIQESINTTMEYNVWLTKLGSGDVWVQSTEPSFFIIQSDKEISFKYKLEGRRKNFEDMTLERHLNKIESEVAI